MDALELAKGYYLEADTPAGTLITTAKMPILSFLHEHSSLLVRDLSYKASSSFGVDPEKIPLKLFGLSEDYETQTVSRFFDVKMIREEEAYLPSDRHKPSRYEPTTSPPVLDIDVSLFTVPDRESFAKGKLDYCPDVVLVGKAVPPMFSADEAKWGIRAGRELKTSCTSQVLDSSTAQCVSADTLKKAYPGQYRAKCTQDMPPTHTFSTSTELFANNKFLYDGSSWSGYNRPDDQKYPAEYNLQVSHVYHFSHALMDDETENNMAEGMPPSTDTDQRGVKHIYTGANEYRGTGRAGSPSAKSGFPANVPFLASNATFFLAPEAEEDVYLLHPIILHTCTIIIYQLIWTKIYHTIR